MQITQTERRDLLTPLVNPAALESAPDAGVWLNNAFANVVFSHITEPSDVVAGQLTGILGYAVALELIQGFDPVDTIQTRLVERGVLMQDADLEAAIKRWLPRLDLRVIGDTLSRSSALGLRLVTSWDDDWPEGFDRLGERAPHVLWVNGNPSVLNDGKSTVAIVGARAATSYGEHVTHELAADLSRTHTIISGAAYGIDGAAHRACIAAGGTTIAYLAGGVERPYPAGHNELIKRIATVGAVVSEVPPGSAPTKWRFLARNRMIAAHAKATVVVEAGWRSGSLNTAGHANSAGRPIGAVPGPITSAASAGCHRLIQEWDAKLIVSAEDVRKLTGDAA